MGGKSKPSAPPPAPPPPPPPPPDPAPARTEAEKAASFKKARRGRSAGLMSSTALETLGTDTTLGAS
ncbi:hypothetical protein UFOVP765_30 [uncultured Caudovirales phage]|uniref:Uncharacterized protein n=1 Tax=uncultured Caudovirales phage TaxID=2100421 RepID=A0A6J5NSQ7_9CAUD|nr:hypothetical protein UFOVP765_30 [uncultured Caudovirales phage]